MRKSLNLNRVLLLAVLVIGLFGLHAQAEDRDATPWMGLFDNYRLNQQNGEVVDGIAGVEWESEKNTQIVAPTNSNYTRDIVNSLENGNTGTQRIGVTLNVKAYIPTFVSFTLSGNGGTHRVAAFGPNTNNNVQIPYPELIFDNEIGGFVDANWNSLGYGNNMEIEPGDGAYIQASDYLKADIRSNSYYKYVVEVDPLVGSSTGINAGSELPVEMSYKVGEGDWVSNSSSEAEVISFADGVTGATTVWHRFRVPYSNEYLAGEYEGQINFKVYTL